MRIWALDDRPYDKCGIEVVEAARARGHKANLFKTAENLRGLDGYVFVRPAQWEPRISFDKKEIEKIRTLRAPGEFKFIQDELQIDVYEDKNAQTFAFKDWMPDTWVYFTKEDALDAVGRMDYPIISKASVGSASHNVRLLKDIGAAVAEIELAFGEGIPVQAGAGNNAKQRGYVLWQEFIHTNRTWRVTRVGDQFHVYLRWNHDDKPFAAPSRVKPTTPVPMCEDVESLLEFAKEFTHLAGTKWVALDILRGEHTGWKLIETSLAWARGNDAAGNAKFYGTNYSLNTQHALLIEEIEKGVFG
jgi:hypothetical protein